jgi:exodeoxyribonuclease V beta subunit
LGVFLSLSLSKITDSNRLTEMEFNFPLNELFSTDKLSNILSSFTKKFGIDSSTINWKHHSVKGFMIGFIDLIFRHDGKYYIVDWKSNKLNGTEDSFEQDGLKHEIASHHYYLQYLIYTVALDKYLTNTMKNYDYDTHFGGVYYIFLRGVSNNENSSRGIFYDKPDKNLISKLSEIMS